jgi:uncharacterized protein YoxC
MSAAEIAAVVVAVASVAGVALLAVGVVTLTRTLGEVRTTVEALRASAQPVLDDAAKVVSGADRVVASAEVELVRVDQLVGSATSVTGTLDALSHLFYLAFSNPIIKLMALGTGTARAARALRKQV